MLIQKTPSIFEGVSEGILCIQKSHVACRNNVLLPHTSTPQVLPPLCTAPLGIKGPVIIKENYSAPLCRIVLFQDPQNGNLSTGLKKSENGPPHVVLMACYSGHVVLPILMSRARSRCIIVTEIYFKILQ